VHPLAFVPFFTMNKTHNLQLSQVEALSRQVEQLEQALQTTTRDYITGALGCGVRCKQRCSASTGRP
jgi:hypothetical protein